MCLNCGYDFGCDPKCSNMLAAESLGTKCETVPLPDGRKMKVVIPDVPADKVNHPAHYGGEDWQYEAIKVIEAWGLDFHLGNAVKYISRAGKKGIAREDLEKAVWYLNRKISLMEI
jgi:hypothetical protein